MSNYPYDYTQDQKLQDASGVGVKRGFVAHLEYADPAAADTDGVLTAVTDTGEEQEIETFDGQPDFTRNITATAGGTAGDIGAIQVIVEGTNDAGETITETLPAFTENTAGTVVGSKAFKKVTKVTIPAHDGTGATTAIGFGDKLGIPLKLERALLYKAFFNDVEESTDPTIAVSATAYESNTVDMNSALDGSPVDVYLIVE